MDLSLLSFDLAIRNSRWDLGLDAVWRLWPGLPKNGEQTVVDKQPGMIPLVNVNTMVQLAVGDLEINVASWHCLICRGN